MTELIDLPFGGAIAYDDVGTGHPLVLVHGHGCSRAFFARNVGPLSERFRVINVDLPGHGESPPRDGGHTMEQYARDLKHVLSTLGLQDVVLLGWSMGSFVVWDLIAQFGTTSLGGHVIVDCGPTDLNQNGWELGAMTLDELFEGFAAAQTDLRASVEASLPFFFGTEPVGEDRRLLVDDMVGIGPNVTACSLISQTVCDYRHVIGTYTLPTLCIWGREDRALPVENAAWLEERIPAEVVILEDAGHASMWDQADRFNGAVGDWIERL